MPERVELPPSLTGRSLRLARQCLSRAGDRISDLVQDAWLAHLSGDSALRAVWSSDRRQRRREERERMVASLDVDLREVGATKTSDLRDDRR
jgi:hypothetical protein